MREITGLLLAAGSSRRFGSQKLLTKIRGNPMVLYSAEALSPCDRVIAVVRDEDAQLREILQAAGIETIINPLARQGIGSSLACGVRATPTSEGWCILCADMPYVDMATTRRIVDTMRAGAEIVVPFYRGSRGHPVGFAKAYRDRLAALEGDSGAREILARASDMVVPLEVDDRGILIDIDTPQDLSVNEAPFR